MELYNSFKQFLSEQQGVEIEKESGDNPYITFKYSGLHFLFVYDRENASYFRLMLPHIVNSAGNNLQESYKRALEISAKYKIGKLVLIHGEVWGAFEQLIPNPSDNNNSIYQLALSILKAMHEQFKNLGTANS